MCNTVHSRH